MARRRFAQVDVFAGAPLGGNPLAVVLDADDLSGDDMQQLARWTNLSETAFLLPPRRAEADYRVRIFTPFEELPFAGHPTLGSCHVWLTAGGAPHTDGRIVQECPAGLIPLRRAADRLAFAAPPLVRDGPVDEATLAAVVAFLGVDAADVLDASWVDNGPGWVGVLLEDADAVLALRPAGRAGGKLDVGVVGVYPPGSAMAVEVRALFSDEAGTVREDPVTGSLNAALAGWLLDSGRVRTPYVASQGTILGHTGRVHVERDADGTVWVGGATVGVVDGHIEL